jgi:hypothetical protein
MMKTTPKVLVVTSKTASPKRGHGGRKQPRPRLLDAPVAFGGRIRRNKEVVA